MAYINVIVQFYPPRAIQLDLFERLPNNIVGLSLGLLSCFDDRRFIDVTFVINVKLSKGVLKAKYILLLELGVFSERMGVSRVIMLSLYDEWNRCGTGGLADRYLCSLMTFMIVSTSLCWNESMKKKLR